MSPRRILNVVALLLIFVGVSMLLSGGIALYFADGDASGIFLSAAITIGVGVVTYAGTRFHEDLGSREGFAIVTFGWTAIAVFGALPYLLTGSIQGIVPAFFESMSGFTTTGATVVTDIEALPHGILFWRSFTQWLGGMGIIVLAIAILPYLGVGGMQLFKAEVPGLNPERLRPRITQTAKLLWFVYLGLTVAQACLYLLGGMDWFDAVNHSFSTLATGGFSTRNASMAAFDSRYIQYVTIVFMYLAGINFSLHFRAAAGRPIYWKDAELRLYTFIILIAAVTLGTMSLANAPGALSWLGAEQAIRDGLFTAASIVTTTGFVTADYELWIPSAQFLVFALMFTGGMAGSTGGGVKIVRVLLILENAWIEVRRHLHPRAILLARVGKRVVREDVLFNVLGFVILYITLFGAGAFAMSLFGMDLATSLGASAATVGNIGPGLGGIGATDNYAWMPAGAQMVLTFLMLVGRLEIYTVLLLFHPETWTNRGATDRRPIGGRLTRS